jgi:serine/threonine protein kinase
MNSAKTISKENSEDFNTNISCLINLEKIKKYWARNKCLSENFELLDIIGYGSESVVCSCSEKTIQKKIIASKIIFNKRKNKNYLNELEISSKLKYKNIVTYFGFCNLIKDESWCLLMEYGKFGNLNNFRRNTIKMKCLPESMICYIAYQILDGLFYCHKNKIAHMDLKPNNIIVDKYLNFKIIDFSISINYKDKNYSEVIKLPIIGTSLYMPLEVLFKQKIKYKELHKVDLYSLGVILYNLAFGTFPYNITSDDQEKYSKIGEKIYINDIGKEIIDNQNGFSKHFLDFLNKLLQKDIYERINIYEAKEHYWIKGSKILLDEKEKTYGMNDFADYLLTNSIKDFNDYIGKNP